MSPSASPVDVTVWEKFGPLLKVSCVVLSSGAGALGTTAPVFDSVTDPLKVPTGGLVSADATSVRIGGFVSGEGLTLAAKLKRKVAKTLKLKLPKAARQALANGAKESARFKLIAKNFNGATGTAKARIKHLTAT